MLEPSMFLIAPGSPPHLADRATGGNPGFEGGKREGKAALEVLTDRLSDLQRRLWGESKQGLLVVIQAMDTGGKDGTIRHVFKGVNPQGVHVRGFVGALEEMQPSYREPMRDLERLVIT